MFGTTATTSITAASRVLRLTAGATIALISVGAPGAFADSPEPIIDPGLILTDPDLIWADPGMPLDPCVIDPASCTPPEGLLPPLLPPDAIDPCVFTDCGFAPPEEGEEAPPEGDEGAGEPADDGDGLVEPEAPAEPADDAGAEGEPEADDSGCDPSYLAACIPIQTTTTTVPVPVPDDDPCAGVDCSDGPGDLDEPGEPGTLPFTGSAGLPLVLIGGGALLGGGAFLFAAQRRRNANVEV